MKPIEEGCLAMYIESEFGNAGKVVTVGRYMGLLEPYLAPNLWEVSGCNISTVYGIRSNTHADESQLMRIDGHEEKEDQKVKELEY